MKSPQQSPALKAYVQKTRALVGDRDPLTLMRATPARIERRVAGLTPAQLKQRPARGKWSIQEILGHLADCEAVFAWRVRRALAEPGAPVHGFSQEKWAECFRYQRIHGRVSLVAYQLLRLTSLGAVDAVTPAVRSRAAVMHTERGRETLAKMTMLIAGHDLNHLGQIEAIIRKYGWGARKARRAAKAAPRATAARRAKPAKKARGRR
jgi:uncharacterized damage-inducible protein DinB